MVTPAFKSQRGNSITVARLFKGLAGRGYDIDILALDDSGWQQQLDLYTSEHSYSIVHGFHAMHSSIVTEHPRISKTPMLLTATGTDINFDMTGHNRQRVLQTLLKAERIVVFNPDMSRRIINADPGLKSRITVIPQGVDLPAGPAFTRKQFCLSESDTVFIMPSGLRPVKNIDLALEGLEKARASNPALKLLIAGAAIDGAYAEHIQSRIRPLAWAVYLGEVPHGEIGGIMRIADVVLSTSIAEGQPQAVLEAMSLGRPCILSAVEGNLGIIEDGVHGCYIRTSSELADAALLLMNDPLLRQKLGSAAMKLVNERYNVKNEIEAYAALYEELKSYC